MSVQSWVKNNLGRQDVDASDVLWNMAYTLIGTGGVMIAVAAISPFIANPNFWVILSVALIGAGLIIAGFAMIRVGETEIPSEPPHKGVLEIWGEKMPVKKDESDAMTAPWWPLRVKYILVNVEACDVTFVFDVHCLAPVDPAKPDATRGLGASATVKIVITYFPDGDDPDESRLMMFINQGGKPAIERKLKGILGEATRLESLKHGVEEFTKMKAILSVALLVQITEIDFRRMIPDEPDGKFSKRLLDTNDADDYKDSAKFVRERDPIEYLLPEPVPPRSATESDDVKKARERNWVKEQEIKIFLRIAQMDGVADVIDFGIRITRLNVEDITPEATFQEASAQVARERKELESESRDTQTRIDMALKIVEASKGADGKPTITFEAAMQADRINIKRATEQIIRTPDISGLVGLLDRKR